MSPLVKHTYMQVVFVTFLVGKTKLTAKEQRPPSWASSLLSKYAKGKRGKREAVALGKK